MVFRRNCIECGRPFTSECAATRCCSDECRRIRERRSEKNRVSEAGIYALRRDRRLARSRRREFLAKCDAAWAKAPQPTVTRVETPDGRIIERRGPIPWGGALPGVLS